MIYEFSAILSDFMKEKNMNFNCLENLTSISSRLLYYYKMGKFLPNVKNLVILANIFECSTDYLLGLTDYTLEITGSYDGKFYDRFVNLLTSNNISKYKLCKELNFRKKNLLNWSNGIIPSTSNLIKLSKYLFTSIDYLIGRNQINK